MYSVRGSVCVLVAAASLQAATGLRKKSANTEAEATADEQLEIEGKVEANSAFADCGFRSLQPLAKEGEPGIVDFTYTFGAPGPASPGLENTRGSSRCFPGLRTWQTEGGTGWVTRSKWLDIVPFITNKIFYWHAWMEGEDITVDRLDEKNMYECNGDHTTVPWSMYPSVGLHDAEKYVETAASKLCPLWTNLTIFAGRKSYILNPYVVMYDVIQYGWRGVGYATHDGTGSVAAGPQISHLIQNPGTLECVVTFQGTANFNDWVSNVAIAPVPFCGLTYEDETCGRIGTCVVRKKRGSFAHWGFADRLRKITRTNEWETNIHSNLPFCSKLYVAGHSAGGAMAELFTACVANTLHPGEFGYEDDYKYMGFVKAKPQKLKYEL